MKKNIKINLKLGGGSEIEVESGKTVKELLELEQTGVSAPRKGMSAAPIHSGKRADVLVAGRLNGKLVDLSRRVEDSGELEPVYLSTPDGMAILRHSASHIMADAVKRLFPPAKVTIGPAIENGFYYDFDYEPGFSPDDFPQIEEKMQEIIEKDMPFERKEITREDAIRLFKDMGESYKVELIQDLPEGEVITLYRHGPPEGSEGFVDLCRGPHLPSTGLVKAFKLTSNAGAYWRGDERNPMLQRLYGTAFPSRDMLDDYLEKLEEARKRDHRKLGKELDLFSVHEEIGPGMVVYHPRLGLVRALLEEFLKKEHLKRGYHIVYGPTLLRSELWQRSGHYDHYKENMYFTMVEDVEYGIKPMNCLSHMLIYKSRIRSYRDLPIRYFEMGTVHRHEKSGVLSGLFRVRAFTQDDAHILCRPDQLEAEVIGVLNFVLDVMDIFDFPVSMEISTMPKDHIGTDEDWQRATNALKGALEHSGHSFDINEGEGAFYGPKIDIKLKDALDREWQCATIQCDFTMPERFDLYYVDADGERKRPAMIHRVVLGSIERFLGILIEHYGGAFPVWLAPTQARIMTITDRHNDYALSVQNRLKSAGMRVESDLRNEKLNKKIREAEVEKIPYMLVVGDKEIKEDGVSPRTHGGDDWKLMKVSEFIERVKDEVRIPETRSNS